MDEHSASHVGVRLAAVLFADVVNFTAMAERDENRAISLLEDFNSRVADPFLDEHKASLRKHLGDGLLATFDSAEAAVACSEALQSALAIDRNEAMPRWTGLSLRIGVHLAEVRFDNDDVLGSGVNLTKRLQEAGQPDGLIISQALYESLSAAQSEKARDLGFLALKGITTPIRAYDLGKSSNRPLSGGEMPSIAVLPFESMGAREEDRYFADGIVEDIIVSLSGLREMVVISRNSTLAFRDRQLDPRDARRILGVRYVLQGSVRRRGKIIRVSATLSDAETGTTMFSTQSDLEEQDLFEAQDQLVHETVACIAPQLRKAELARAIRKPPDVFSAYDKMLRALDLMRSLNQEAYDDAGKLLDAATAEDPEFAAAFAWKAAWVMVMVAQGWIPDRETAGAMAEAAAKRAVELDESNALALATLGHVKAFLMGDHEAALSLLERARKVGPGNAIVLIMSAGGMAYVGRGDEAVAFAEQAHQLVPLDNIPFREFDWLSLANYAAGNFTRAAFWARRALDEQSAHLPSLRLLAASSAAVGDTDNARRAVDALLKCQPEFRVSTYAKTYTTFGVPPLQHQWLNHLRQAGFPT